MNRRLVPTVIVAAVLALGIASAVSSAPSPTVLQRLPSYDAQQLGFEFEPVPFGAAAARVSQSEAATAAANALGMAGKQPEVKELIARITPDEPKRRVWVVVYDGGDAGDVPWGPYTDTPRALKAPTYSGALVDVASGEVLVRFRGGTQ